MNAPPRAAGAKSVLSLNNIGLLGSLLVLPTAAKGGAGAVWACIALMGIMQVAVGETVILPHPTVPSVGVSTWIERGCQQSDSLADGTMQGPFIVAQGAMTSSWVIAGPEKPIAVFIIRLGKAWPN